MGAARTGKEEDVEVGLQYFGKRYYAPLLNRWVSADPLTIHGLGADPNVYSYVSGRALQSTDPLGLDDEPKGATEGFEVNGETGEVNATVTFSDATIHAKPPRPAVTDQDKIADALGVPRAETQGGVPTAEAVDRGQMALPSGVRDDKSLRPIIGPGGVQAWTTESGGTRRRYSTTGDRAGYAGEKPVESTISPIDLAGPGLARGLWMLGGRGLRFAGAGRMKYPDYSFGETGGALGQTDKFGNITLKPGLSGKTLTETLRHESVHSYLSPSAGGKIQALRADFGMWAYKNSHLLRYTEEAAAETYATGSLAQGLKFPFSGYGISPLRLGVEGAVFGGAVVGPGVAASQLK